MSRGNVLRWCRCEDLQSSAATRRRVPARYQEQAGNLWAASLAWGGCRRLVVLLAMQERAQQE